MPGTEPPLNILIGGNEKLREATAKALARHYAANGYTMHDQTESFKANPYLLSDTLVQETLFAEASSGATLLLSSYPKEAEGILEELVQRDPEECTGIVVMSVKTVGAKVKALLEEGTRNGIVRSKTFTSAQAKEQATFYLSMFPLNTPSKNRLIDHVGKDIGVLPLLVQELMLSVGKHATPGNPLSSSEVNEFLAKQYKSPPAWDLTDALDRQDAKAALIYGEQLMQEKNPYFVYIILSNYFSLMMRASNLVGVSDREIMQVTGMKGGSTFPVTKARERAKDYGGTLPAIFRLIDETGVALRSRGTAYAPAAIAILISRIAHYPRKRNTRS